MDYELRTKTKRILTTAMEGTELNGIIDKVCQMTEEKAKEYIWQLTYNLEQAFGPHVICLNTQDENKLRVIRGELINQYRKLVNCDFGYQEHTKPKEGESKAITKLRKLAEGDGVIICEIQKRVKNCFLNTELIKWYVKTLRHGEDKNVITALRDIGFKGEGEADFVLKYADIIAALLEERAKS